MQSFLVPVDRRRVESLKSFTATGRCLSELMLREQCLGFSSDNAAGTCWVIAGSEMKGRGAQIEAVVRAACPWMPFDRSRSQEERTSAALLKALLGRWWGCKSMVSAPGRKPYFLGQRHTWSITYGGGLVMLGWGRDLGGIDAEREDPVSEGRWMALRRVAPSLEEWAREESRRERDRAFYRAWTAVEAVAKRRGAGLSARSLRRPSSDVAVAVTSFSFEGHMVSVASSRACMPALLCVNVDAALDFLCSG